MKLTVKDALATCGLSAKQWKHFLDVVADNKRIHDVGWAYVGGMRDVLWVLAQEDKKTFDRLNRVINKVKARS